jgi:hypothetical protein
MNPRDALHQIQSILNNFAPTAQDGISGNQTNASFALLSRLAAQQWQDDKAEAAKHSDDPLAGAGDGEHKVKATSFADLADVASFRHCKAGGGSDNFCFSKGDNGIGFTGLDCTDESIPYVALPPEDWAAKWGSARAATGQAVKVTIRGQTVICKLADTMPHKAHIHNGAGLDLAPGAQKAFGLRAPVDVEATWSWA